jgi:tellurite resistance-related uncharacterized protein
MEKSLDFFEMSNINVLEDLSVTSPAAWYEVDDCSDDCSRDCDDNVNK